MWEGGRWVVPAVAEVTAARIANGPEDQPCTATAGWDKTDWRAQDRRDRRGGRADSRGQGGDGGAGAPVHYVVASPRGPARVYPEGIKPCEAEAARHSRADGPLPPAAGPSRAGAGVGGPVRTSLLRVPAGPQLPGRDRGDLHHLRRPDGQAGMGAGRRPGRGVRPNRP